MKTLLFGFTLFVLLPVLGAFAAWNQRHCACEDCRGRNAD